MRCSEEIENKILLKRKLTEFSFDNMVKHCKKQKGKAMLNLYSGCKKSQVIITSET
jgi:hypothetical protein